MLGSCWKQQSGSSFCEEFPCESKESDCRSVRVSFSRNWIHTLNNPTPVHADRGNYSLTAL
eukprot:1340472-Pleurochrysis_carterae.AAC.1